MTSVHNHLSAVPDGPQVGDMVTYRGRQYEVWKRTDMHFGLKDPSRAPKFEKNPQTGKPQETAHIAVRHEAVEPVKPKPKADPPPEASLCRECYQATPSVETRMVRDDDSGELCPIHDKHAPEDCGVDFPCSGYDGTLCALNR